MTMALVYRPSKARPFTPRNRVIDLSEGSESYEYGSYFG